MEEIPKELGLLSLEKTQLRGISSMSINISGDGARKVELGSFH